MVLIRHILYREIYGEAEAPSPRVRPTEPDWSRAPASRRLREMTPPPASFLIIADGDFGPLTSKTANSCIRYFPERIVRFFDRKQAGKTAQDVLGFGGKIPVVGDFERGIAQAKRDRV